MTERLEHVPSRYQFVPAYVFNALIDVVNTLLDGAALYEAHTENLISRMARVDEHLWPEEWVTDDDR